MKDVKYDIKRVPRELLEAYVCYQLCMSPDRRDPIDATSDVGKCVVKAAEVQLRTKAEVDADIAKAVKDYATEWATINNTPLQNLTFSGAFGRMPTTLAERFKELLLEETSD